MLFSDLVAEAVAHKALNVRTNRLGTLLDLFGNCKTEEMSTLLIEERLRGAAGRLTHCAISMYRSTLRSIFAWAVKTGKAASNPVPSVGSHRGPRASYAEELERLRAVEFLRKVKDPCSKKGWGKGRALLQREAVSHICRIAGQEWAEAIRALFAYLGDSEILGPRDKNKWQQAVELVAQKPDASNREIARLCGVDKDTIQKWRFVKNGGALVPREDFQQAVRIERHEVPTEDEIRAANSSLRRSIAGKEVSKRPGVHERQSADSKSRWKDQKYRRRTTRGIKNSWKVDDIRKSRIKGQADPEVRAAMSAGSKKRWTPEERLKASESKKQFWADDRKRKRTKAKMKKTARERLNEKKISGGEKRYTTAEAVKQTGVSRGSIKFWIASGKISAPDVQLVGGMRVRFWTDADLERIGKLGGTKEHAKRHAAANKGWGIRKARAAQKVA